MLEKFNLVIFDNIVFVDVDFVWYAWKEVGFLRKFEGFLWNLWNIVDVVFIFLICLSFFVSFDMYFILLLLLLFVSLMLFA